MAKGSSSSVIDDADVFAPPPVVLHQLNTDLETGRLMDCWNILQRSSVDAAVLPSSDSNLFSFAGSCIYIASVHDLNFTENSAKEREERQRQQAAEETNVGRSSSPEQVSFSAAYREGNLARALQAAFNKKSPTPVGRHEDDAPIPMDWQPQASSSNSTSTAHATGNAESDQNRITPYFIKDSINAPTSAFPEEQITPDERDNIADFDLTAPADQRMLDSSKKEAGDSDLIGIAYLYSGSDAASVSACEVCLGVALLPHARGKGYGTEAVRKLMKLAFEELGFHRVSANVIGPSLSRPATRTVSGSASSDAKKRDERLLSGTVAEIEAALRMFVALGFTLEGTKRRAIRDLDNNGVWRDSYHLAMLDTDFMFRSRQLNANGSPSTRPTRWDEMLTRHQSETDALATAESRLKRSASTETLRPSSKTNGTTINFNLTPSSVSASTVPSETASENGGESHGQHEGQEDPFPSARALSNPFSSSSSVHSSSQNQFLSASVAPHVLRARLKPVFSFDSDSETTSQADTDDANVRLRSDSEEFMAKFDKLHEKVEDFLRKNPAPGPPPSEVGTHLDSETDSETDSASDFESCADSDELNLLGGANSKGKGKAKEFYFKERDSDQERIPLLVAGASASSTHVDLIKKGSPTRVSTPDDRDAEEQARKKRRFSDGSAGGPNAVAMVLPPFVFSFNNPENSLDVPKTTASPTNVGTAHTPDNPFSDPSTTASPSRGIDGDTTVETVTAIADPEAYRAPDTDSEMYDSGVASTASTWSVVSSASAPRSPSPTASLASGTGSLSLQSASEGEIE